MSSANASPSGESPAETLARLECPAFAVRREKRAAIAGGVASAIPPLVLERGEGTTLIGTDGRRYHDLVAGFGSLLLGHGDPRVTGAIEQQSRQLVQGLGDLYGSAIKARLLERLAALHPNDDAQVLLAQAGGDAVAGALKTAALATGRAGVLAFDGAYHGLGYGPLAACGYQTTFRKAFEPQLNPHVRFAPYPGVRGAGLDAALSVAKQALRDGSIGAVLVEPVVGRGGCVVPPDAFLPELCALAHHVGALVIADEIWTGLGRTGSWLRSAALEAPVDILCLGKGLGGGLPIAACVASGSVMGAWAQGGDVVHTSTHVGNPLACAAALATLDAVEADALPERAAGVGAEVREALTTKLEGHATVRGVGLMIGVELADGAVTQRAVSALLDRGYVVVSGGVHGDALTITPALTVDPAILLGFGDALREILAS